MNNHKLNALIFLILAFFSTSCGSGSTENAEEKLTVPMTLEEAEKGWETNKGIGPIKNLEFAPEIDQSLADAGMVVFEDKCAACHKVEKKFIGPSPKGILKKRTPEWVMNMILNPDEMVKKDPIARQLLMKFSAPMANQNLTEGEARSVVEYFRTL